MPILPQIRALLLSSTDAPSLPELLENIDADPIFDSDSLTTLISLIDHTSLTHTNIFLAVLHRLKPRLSSTHIISTWFDLILRPALKEPRLSSEMAGYAKDLTLFALADNKFRTRLLVFYLLDVFSDTSEDDIMEWVALEPAQREQSTVWKTNLEDILIQYGSSHPNELLDELLVHFATPSHRLKLLTFLDAYAMSNIASHMIHHSFMTSLLKSLQLDNSATTVSIALSILTKLLPVFAANTPDVLTALLPTLFNILARVLSWDEHLEDLHPALDWEILEMIFTTSTPPSPHRYFTFLYYLFPSSLLHFLRGPTEFMEEIELEFPTALNDEKIRNTAESVLHTHICHPMITYLRDDFWKGYSVEKIVSEALLLDVHKRTAESADPDKIPVQPVCPPDSDITVTEAIATLQRQVIILRSDLYFEQCLSRENVKHIERLFEARVVSKNVEAERQALSNKLRLYRTELAKLRLQLTSQLNQAQRTKESNKDWNDELVKKNTAFRAEKAKYDAQINALRSSEEQWKEQWQMQSRLLDESMNECFMLKVKQKEVQTKVERLRDYEMEIERLINVQKVYEADWERFGQREGEIKELRERDVQMKLQLESLQALNTLLEEEVRRQKFALDAHMQQEPKQVSSGMSAHVEDLLVMVVEERQKIERENRKLKEERLEAKEELEELRAMVELLKGEVKRERASPSATDLEATGVL